MSVIRLLINSPSALAVLIVFELITLAGFAAQLFVWSTP